MSKSFVQLHCHTSYSLLDGAAKVDELVEAAAKDGQPAIASTDHGNLYAVVPMYQACKKQGIKYIVGSELYQARESVSERPPKGKKAITDDSGGQTQDGRKINYHLTALAENNTGYKNLIQLSSRSYLQGRYIKPPVDWEMLEEHHEGLIVTTGCLGGQVLQALLRNDTQEALRVAARLQDIFGRNNTFVEVQDHGLADQKCTMTALFDLAKKIDAPIISSNDSHYTHAGDAHSHDALLAVQTGCTLSKPDRFKFESDQHYLKSAAEMRALFPDHPEAADNTLWIAERSNVTLDFDTLHFPKYPVPEGYIDDSQYLTELVLQGAVERWGKDYNDGVLARLAYELKVIQDQGFSSYFLVVWDLLNYARRNNIRVGPGRGSAGGSGVAFALGITQLDPIKYGLMFERFLNPARISPPDIDTDVSPRGREQLIRYAAEKYGQDHVAQIVTFSRIKARSAVRDAARVLEKPYIVGDKISKAMPPLLMGRDTPLAACFEKTEGYEAGYSAAERLRDMYVADPDVKEVVDVARGLEGLHRQDGVHGGAVVIADAPLTEYLPVQRASAEGSPIVTQYEMHAVGDLGLLKVDLLGLRNLDVIEDCLIIIRRSGGAEIEIDRIPLDDVSTLDLLRQGDTIGVFQLESKPMRDLIRRLRPDRFEDVAALVALYRPGPMAANMHNDYADRKNGRQVVTYFHDDAREILKDTYGECIYQEQLLAIARKFAGYTLGESDLLRAAVGKKNLEKMAQERDRFIQGCVTQGYGQDFGEALFKMTEAFASYSFNKSHSLLYGFIAYQTAYLKANYPAEYMAALCSSVSDKLDRMGGFLSEARAMGLVVRVPDVNKSEVGFTVVDGEILVGLGAIKGLGELLAERIVAEREKGPYTGVWDLASRIVGQGINKTVFANLIEAGALDQFGESRLGMAGMVVDILEGARKDAAKAKKGMVQLFDDLEQRVEIPDVEYSQDEKLRLEKQLMGIYVTGHPLDHCQEWARENADTTTEDVADCYDGQNILIAGVVTGLDVTTTRKGDQMAKFTVEDQYGGCPVVVFPQTWVGLRETFMKDSQLIAIFKCRVKDNEDEKDLICFDVAPLDRGEGVSSQHTDYRIFIPSGFHADDKYMAKLRAITLEHRGKTPVRIHYSRKSHSEMGDGYGVDGSPSLKVAIKALFQSWRDEKTP